MPDWKPSPEVLAETEYLQLIQDGHWSYAKRPNITGAIAIVAVTDDDELLLVDQYRIPVLGRVIELPAGLVGDLAEHRSETLEEAARRELVEEAGYEAKEVRVLTRAASSAGLTDETVHLLWADGLRRVGEGGGDESEDIIVCRVPVGDVNDWIIAQQQAGKLVDYKVFAGLYYLHYLQQYRGATS